MIIPSVNKTKQYSTVMHFINEIGTLSEMTTGDTEYDIECVSYQEEVKDAVFEQGGGTTHTPVLTLITNLKYKGDS